MKKLALLSTASLAMMAGAAMAADLPARRAPPPFVAVPVFTWTGFYAGINAGYAFSDDGRIRTFGNNPGTALNVAVNARPQSFRLDREGFTGGGQIGYNYQIGMFVVGLEADAAYTDFGRTRSFQAANAPGFPISTFRSDMDFLGTVRGRVGVALDRFMVYGTGGFAYGDVQHSANFFGAIAAAPGNGTLTFAGGRSRIETGYAVGGGVEYAFPSFAVLGLATTVKAEYLYFDLGRRSVVVAGQTAATAGTSYTSRFSNDGHIVRAGLNLKFNLF